MVELIESLQSESSKPAWKDPRTLRTHSEIQQHLALLTARENQLSVALNEIISNRTGIDESIKRLNALVPKVQHLELEVNGRNDNKNNHHHSSRNSFASPEQQRPAVFGDSDDDSDEDNDEGLVERVRRVWITSERVGGKVRKLDDEVGRIKEASERVQEVLELKSALQSLRAAIPKGDWELATRCCKRAMDIKKEVLEGAFSARVIPTSSDPLPPPQALEQLRTQLLITFKDEFNQASAKKDEQATSRFFKLFPMIGAEEEGLEVYGDFVTTLVNARNPTSGKPSSPLYYIAHLTSLLESIALIIDQHQNVVDKYYGEGKMRVVVGRLQAEADKVVKGLVEGWEDERRVGRLISETKQTLFEYLNNPVQSSSLSSATAHVQASLTALSHAQQGLAGLPGAATSLLAQYAGAKRPQEEIAHEHQQPEEQEERRGPDPRDVDRIVGEMVTLSGRWALYRRFAWNRLAIEDDSEANTPTGEINNEVPPTDTVITEIDESDSQKVISNMLRTYYEPLEAWYLRTSIEKSHKMDTPDLTDRPHVSSVVDDVFYLLKLVLNRVITSGSISTFKSMSDNVGRIMERDYLGVLQKKMDAVYSGGGAAIGLLGSNLPGVNKEAEKERREKELRISYSVLLNDLDLSASYMERLVDETLSGGLAEQWFLDTEIPIVQRELKKLVDLGNRMRSVSKSGIDQLFNQLTRPRLRSLLEDVYKGVSYLLDEDTYAEAENDDLVRKRFMKGWEPLVEGYKASFTDTNFHAFFSMMVEVLVRPWEKMVLGMRFTELGAIRFDRDVRSVSNYLSSQTDFGGSREKFTRLQQMATILNLDPDEDPEEFYGSSGIAWRLSKAEYDGIVGIKV